jgi:protein-tyrosine phosphatase
MIVGVSNWFRTYGYAEVLDELVVGAYPLDEKDVAMLEWLGIERVLNLAQDSEYADSERETTRAALERAGIEEYRVGLVDHGELPAEALEDAVQRVLAWLDDGRRVYLHCRAGWQRSAAVGAGVVALRDGIDVADALDSVRARKPSADPLPHQRADLIRWWERRQR